MPAYDEPRETEEPAPDMRPVTKLQAAYLADVSGVAAERIVGRPIAELDDLLRWRIDPRLLRFRKVCGRVVKTNPVTGEVQGVPHATVHVEDTDCSFLWFFPIEGPFTNWSWLWLTSCHREVIGTTKTNLCGEFCVWIPRWDIDRILRLRLKRVCLPDLVKPSLRDVITRMVEQPQPRPGIGPNPPDPAGFALPERHVMRQIGQTLRRPGLEYLADRAGARAFGDDVAALHEVLDAPAFVDPPRPPLSEGALERLERVSLRTGAELDLNPARAIGPFLRCHDVLSLEWQTIYDVPDITFSVTQDVDLDGTEETIYSESLFDVRWNAGPIPDVTLNAAPYALSTPFCGDVPPIACENHPRIATAGGQPLESTHHDNANGQSIRVNRPHPLGLISSAPTSLVPVGDGVAPYAGVLRLRGCFAVAGAQFYRVLVTGPSTTESAITGFDWLSYTNSGTPIAIVMHPDPDGWIAVPSAAQLADLADPNMFMPWPTGAAGDYSVRLELADAAHAPLTGPARYSDPVLFRIDNEVATPSIDQIRWRVAGAANPWLQTFTPPFACVVIERPPHTGIELEVQWSASATHLLYGQFGAGGCQLGHDPIPVDAIDHMEHWYANPTTDNAFGRTATYQVPGSYLQGSYSLSAWARSRAFQPDGDRVSGSTPLDWDFSTTENPNLMQINIAIIDA